MSKPGDQKGADNKEEKEKKEKEFDDKKKHDEVTADGKKVVFINPILNKESIVPVVPEKKELAKEIVKEKKEEKAHPKISPAEVEKKEKEI